LKKISSNFLKSLHCSQIISYHNRDELFNTTVFFFSKQKFLKKTQASISTR